MFIIFMVNPIFSAGHTQKERSSVHLLQMSIDMALYRKYLPISDVARDWGLWCTDAGASEVKKGDSYPAMPKSHPDAFSKGLSNGLGRVLQEFQLIYITKGQGSFRWTGEDGIIYEAPVEAGTAMILFPGIWHSYAPDKLTGWNEYWVGFKGDIPLTLQKKGLLDVNKPVCSVGLHEDLLADYREVFSIIDQEPPSFQMILGGLILKMLGRVTSLTQEGGMATGMERTVRKAKMYFEEHLEGNMEMDDLLERVNMSYSAFQRSFKEYTGLSPYRYFLQLKIHEACRLLMENHFTIKEIAFKLSFENPYYFSRLFKKKTGLTPTEWQRGALLSEEQPGGIR